MSLDRIPFTLNEQFGSDDQNQQQIVIERYLHDLLGFSAQARALQNAGSAVTSALLPDACVGGFEASASGTSLTIQPGILVTVNWPDLGEEAPLSTYRLAVNRLATAVALPSPATDTWYVVGGRPVLEDDLSVPRRVWDEDLPGWTDTPLVKRRRAAMVFEVVEGTATEIPLTMPEDTVPLYAVFRPGAGGDIDDTTDVLDLCPLPQARVVDTQTSALLQNRWTMDVPNALALHVHATLNGVELFAVGSGLDPLDFKDPTDAAPALQEWWYLYLAPFPALGGNCVPRHAQLGVGTLKQQGLLIFSKKAPHGPESANPRTNSVALRAPAPFSGIDIAPGTALWFGALKRKPGSGPDYWVGCNADGDHVRIFATAGASESQSLIQTVSFTTSAFDSAAPVGAREVDYYFGVFIDGSSVPGNALTLTDSAAARILYRKSWTIPTGATDALFEEYATIALAPDRQFVPSWTEPPASTSTSIVCNVVGYRF